MNKKNLMVTLFFMVILSACSSATMNTEMESWVGKPIDDAVAVLGKPNSRIPGDDGGITHTWITRVSDDRDAAECHQTVVTDSTGTIVSSAARNCPVLAPIEVNLE
jgi:hypothetical protein